MPQDHVFADPGEPGQGQCGDHVIQAQILNREVGEFRDLFATERCPDHADEQITRDQRPGTRVHGRIDERAARFDLFVAQFEHIAHLFFFLRVIV